MHLVLSIERAGMVDLVSVTEALKCKLYFCGPNKKKGLEWLRMADMSDPLAHRESTYTRPAFLRLVLVINLAVYILLDCRGKEKFLSFISSELMYLTRYLI